MATGGCLALKHAQTPRLELAGRDDYAHHGKRRDATAPKAIPGKVATLQSRIRVLGVHLRLFPPVTISAAA